MRSVNDNLKIKKELEDKLKKFRADAEREEKELEMKIKEQAKFIQAFLEQPEDVALGMQLVEIRKRSDKYKKELINLMRFAMRKIEEGYLPELIQKREVFGYWYNSGFDSGHSRVITRNYGENYASERAQIRLTDSLYDEGKITTQETLAILAYLKQKLVEIEAQS